MTFSVSSDLTLRLFTHKIVFTNGFKHMASKKLLGAVVLIAFGVIGRFLLIDLPNVEMLTVTALLAGAMIGGVFTVIVPLAVVALSDMINVVILHGSFAGNDPIIYFTWSAWAVIGLLGYLLRKSKKGSFKFAAKMTGMGLGASLWFFVWTNLGVWMLFSMYPKTLEGLVQCYAMAIPFFRNQIIGNLVIIPIVVIPIVLAIKHAPKYIPILKAKLSLKNR